MINCCKRHVQERTNPTFPKWVTELGRWVLNILGNSASWPMWKNFAFHSLFLSHPGINFNESLDTKISLPRWIMELAVCNPHIYDSDVEGYPREGICTSHPLRSSYKILSRYIHILLKGLHFISHTHLSTANSSPEEIVKRVQHVIPNSMTAANATLRKLKFVE